MQAFYSEGDVMCPSFQDNSSAEQSTAWPFDETSSLSCNVQFGLHAAVDAGNDWAFNEFDSSGYNDPPPQHSFTLTPPVQGIESTLALSPLMLPQSSAPVDETCCDTTHSHMDNTDLNKGPSFKGNKQGASQAQAPLDLVSIAFSPNQLTRLSDPSSIEPLILPGGCPADSVMSQHHFHCDDKSSLSVPATPTTLQFLPQLYNPPTMIKASPKTVSSRRATPTKKQGAGQRRKANPIPRNTGSKQAAAASSARGGPNKDKRRYCHVCRSPKEISRIVRCCSGKQSHVFCSSCVQRRLGLVFEELLKRDDWLCPKCENRCPCSKCRKRNPVPARLPTTVMASV